MTRLSGSYEQGPWGYTGPHCRHCADGVSINFRQDRAGTGHNEGRSRRRVAHEAMAVPMSGDKVVEDGDPSDNAMGRQREDVKGPIVNATVGDENDAAGKY